MNDISEIIDVLSKQFPSHEVKTAILDESWLLKNLDTKIDSTGFCYSACIVIYRLTGEIKKHGN